MVEDGHLYGNILTVSHQPSPQTNMYYFSDYYESCNTYMLVDDIHNKKCRAGPNIEVMVRPKVSTVIRIV